LRQAIFHHKATGKDWVVGALHIIDGQDFHKVPGKQASRQAFKSDCIRRALNNLLNVATYYSDPHIILVGDLNARTEDVQTGLTLVQNNKPNSNNMYVVGDRRDFIISTAELSKVAGEFPTAWDSQHQAIVVEVGQAPLLSCCLNMVVSLFYI
jgi:hypothetical protein